MGLFNRMKDPVEGMAQVISSSAPPRATSGNCKMTLVVQADGVPATSVRVHDIVSTKKWPFPGTVLPVQVDRANPEKVKVLWDKVQSHEESAKADADALAAMMRGETPPPDRRRPASIRRCCRAAPATSCPSSSRCSPARTSRSRARR